MIHFVMNVRTERLTAKFRSQPPLLKIRWAETTKRSKQTMHDNIDSLLEYEEIAQSDISYCAIPGGKRDPLRNEW